LHELRFKVSTKVMGAGLLFVFTLYARERAIFPPFLFLQQFVAVVLCRVRRFLRQPSETILLALSACNIPVKMSNVSRLLFENPVGSVLNTFSARILYVSMT